MNGATPGEGPAADFGIGAQECLAQFGQAVAAERSGDDQSVAARRWARMPRERSPARR